jgi:hypothetical protein
MAGQPQASVSKQRAALQEALNTMLQARYAGSLKLALPGIQQEAAKMLAIRCTAADTGCKLEDTSPAFRSYAEAWLKQAETYAAALAKVKDKVGSPPDTTAK